MATRQITITPRQRETITTITHSAANRAMVECAHDLLLAHADPIVRAAAHKLTEAIDAWAERQVEMCAGLIDDGVDEFTMPLADGRVYRSGDTLVLTHSRTTAQSSAALEDVHHVAIENGVAVAPMPARIRDTDEAAAYWTWTHNGVAVAPRQPVPLAVGDVITFGGARARVTIVAVE
jgi:hypothetical protein